MRTRYLQTLVVIDALLFLLPSMTNPTRLSQRDVFLNETDGNVTTEGVTLVLPSDTIQTDLSTPLNEEPRPPGWNTIFVLVGPSDPVFLNGGLITLVFALATEAKKEWNSNELQFDFLSPYSTPLLKLEFTGSRTRRPSYKVKNIIWGLVDLYFYFVEVHTFYPLTWRTVIGATRIGVGRMDKDVVSLSLVGCGGNFLEAGSNVTNVTGTGGSGDGVTVSPLNTGLKIVWTYDGQRPLRLISILTALIQPMTIVGELDTAQEFPQDGLTSYNPAGRVSFGISCQLPMSDAPDGNRTLQLPRLKNGVMIDAMMALAFHSYTYRQSMGTGLGLIELDGVTVGSVVLRVGPL